MTANMPSGAPRLSSTSTLRTGTSNRTESLIGYSTVESPALQSLSRFLHMNAAKLGARLLEASVATVHEQAAAIAALVRRQVRCLLYVAPSEAGLEAALASCAAAGIPTICLGTIRTGALSGLAGSFETAESAARTELASHMFRRVGGRGTIVYLYDRQSPIEADRLRAIQLTAAAFPHIVIRPVAHHLSAEVHVSEIRTSDGTAQDLVGVIASSDNLAMEAVAAFAGSGTEVPPICGFGGTYDALRSIERGALAATARFDPDAMTKAALSLALASTPNRAFHAELPISIQQITADNASDVLDQEVRSQQDILDQISLRFSEQRATCDFLEQVIDTLPLNLFVKDAKELRYIRINKARSAWFGVDPEEHLGKSAHDLYPPELADRFEASDREVLAGRKGTLPDEHPTISPRPGASGGARYVQTYKLPIHDLEGNPAYLVGVTLDVTERKAAEVALAQRNLELEAAQATMEKQQSKLVIAEKMASIGRLTAGIAHEMNTPLAAVRASMSELQALVNEYSDALGDSEVSIEDHRAIAGEMNAAISIADKSAARAAAFVRGITSQTRGRSSNPRMPFNAVAVVEESLLLLSHALRASKCTTKFNCSTFDSRTDYVELVGSPASFSQAVTNLVTNAIDASRPKGGVIELELVSSGNRVSLRVTDHGCGIPPEILSNIFEPMFTTKPFGQGTGLGLSILHDIVTGEFDGSVEVYSTVGKGTTFELFLGPTIDRLPT